MVLAFFNFLNYCVQLKIQILLLLQYFLIHKYKTHASCIIYESICAFTTRASYVLLQRWFNTLLPALCVLTVLKYLILSCALNSHVPPLSLTICIYSSDFNSAITNYGTPSNLGLSPAVLLISLLFSSFCLVFFYSPQACSGCTATVSTLHLPHQERVHLLLLLSP